MFLLQFFLGHLYELVFSIVLSPADIGWPMHRPRRFTVLILRKSLVFMSNVHTFFALFLKSLRLSGASLFLATREQIQCELEHWQEANSRHCATSLVESLSGGLRTRISTVEAWASESGHALVLVHAHARAAQEVANILAKRMSCERSACIRHAAIHQRLAPLNLA